MIYLATSRGLLEQPGTVAFLVIFGMAVILFFVFRSMARHLRKINMAARAEEEAAAKAQEDGTVAADGGSGPSGARASGGPSGTGASGGSYGAEPGRPGGSR